MKCFDLDVAELGLAFYGLWSPAKAEGTFQRLADTVRYYDRYLDLYPSAMVQPLEDLYSLARCLGAFDATFLSVQLNQVGGWRGIVSGGIYSMLRPDPSLLSHLTSVQPPPYPENLWACQCAIASINNGP